MYIHESIEVICMGEEKQLSSFINLLENAANVAAEGITIGIVSDTSPLIYANKGFERLTGYAVKDVIGKNCRFLQGEKTDEAAVDEIRQAIKKGEECTVELLNYKKDGTPFWNRLSISPLKNEEGVVTHYIGVQSDITELIETKERLEIANKELEIFRDKINAELDQASKAQKFILPLKLPDNNLIKFSAIYKPMDQIGGDFYDVLELGEGIYGVLVADVTGHGIPASLLTFMTSLAFKNSALNVDSTELLVSLTNKNLIGKMPKNAFITMFYAIYDSNSKILKYTQAGHPPAFVIRHSTQEVIMLETAGNMVGVFSERKVAYGENIIRLHAGDKIVLYTDAIIESRSRGHQMLGIDGLSKYLRDHANHPIDELLQKTYQYGLDFSGGKSFDDDFTMVGFEVLS